MPPAPLLAVLPLPSIAELLPGAWARQTSPRTTRSRKSESQISLGSNCSVPSYTPPQNLTVRIVPPSISYSVPVMAEAYVRSEERHEFGDLLLSIRPS